MGDGGRPPRIAVVDDQELNRRLIAMTLDRRFGDVVLSEGWDGREAIALRLSEPPPDLMIVNGLMPVMEGQQAITEIRRLEAEQGLPRVPIAITSKDQWWIDAGLAAGADAALRLPFDNRELVALISRLLVRAPAPRQARPAPPPAAPGPHIPPPLARFPMEITVDETSPGGSRSGTDEDGRCWVAVPTSMRPGEAFRALFGFDCAVYEAVHTEIWQDEPAARRTCEHRTRVTELRAPRT